MYQEELQQEERTQARMAAGMGQRDYYVKLHKPWRDIQSLLSCALNYSLTLPL